MTEGPRAERLHSSHDVSTFRCGNAELDAWLHRHAVPAQAMDSSRTFVLARDAEVLGYYSLTMCSISRQEAPARLVRGMPRYPVGAVLLARLAVAERQQGAGIGSRLLADALLRALVAGESAAARLVVVDAIDANAVRFYERFGFVAVPEHPRRLYRRMKDIRASVDAARS